MSILIHTTKSAAEYLQRRYGIEVQVRTVKQWCNRKKLKGAYKVGDGRRGFWQIPETDLDIEAKSIQSKDVVKIEK